MSLAAVSTLSHGRQFDHKLHITGMAVDSHLDIFVTCAKDGLLKVCWKCHLLPLTKWYGLNILYNVHLDLGSSEQSDTRTPI